MRATWGGGGCMEVNKKQVHQTLAVRLQAVGLKIEHRAWAELTCQAVGQLPSMCNLNDLLIQSYELAPACLHEMVNCFSRTSCSACPVRRLLSSALGSGLSACSLHLRQCSPAQTPAGKGGHPAAAALVHTGACATPSGSSQTWGT